jgi:hypothetical protein
VIHGLGIALKPDPFSGRGRPRSRLGATEKPGNKPQRTQSFCWQFFMKFHVSWFGYCFKTDPFSGRGRPRSRLGATLEKFVGALVR